MKTAITAILVASAAAILSAPPTQAGVVDLRLEDTGWHGYDIGCTYRLYADLDPETEGEVHFYDNGIELPGSPVWPTYQAHRAVIEWTPQNMGSHELFAWQRRPFGTAKTTALVTICPGSACA